MMIPGPDALSRMMEEDVMGGAKDMRSLASLAIELELRSSS